MPYWSQIKRRWFRSRRVALKRFQNHGLWCCGFVQALANGDSVVCSGFVVLGAPWNIPIVCSFLICIALRSGPFLRLFRLRFAIPSHLLVLRSGLAYLPTSLGSNYPPKCESMKILSLKIVCSKASGCDIRRCNHVLGIFLCLSLFCSHVVSQ